MSPLIGTFPDPYPGELLYSIAARYEERVGDWRARTTPRELFGSSHVVASSLCPSHLATLTARLPGQLLAANQFGPAHTAETLLQEHTLLPLYVPFLPPDRLTRIRKDFLGAGGPWVQGRMGIKASTVSAPRWLRYCPVCAQEDVTNMGEPYWHREHQAPGAVICAQHLVWLERSSVRARGQVGRHLFIPASQALDETTKARRLGRSRERDILIALTRAVNTLLSCQAPPRDLAALRTVYLQTLIGQGLASMRGRVCMCELVEMFLATYPESVLRLLACQVLDDECHHDHWLARLVRKPHHAHHPLHHLLLQHFLGLTVEDVLAASAPERAVCPDELYLTHRSVEIDSAMQPRQLPEMQACRVADNRVNVTQTSAGESALVPRLAFGTGPWPCLNPVCAHFRRPVITRCTLTWPATAHGRPLGTFACSCGFIYKRLGPDLHPEDRFQAGTVVARGALWDQRLTELWADGGAPVNAIARELNVDSLTIKRHAKRLGFPLVRSRRCHYRLLELKAPLKGVRFYTVADEDLARKRAAWQTLLHSNPDTPAHRLRQRDNGLYAWLYRHDREWLRVHLPPRRVDHKRRLRVNWINRDHNVALAIQHAASDLLSECNGALKKPKRITCSLLGQRTGHRALLQQHLDQLPKTSQCLDTVCESWEAFAVRRVRWVAACYLRERQVPKQWELIRRAGISRHMSCTPSPVLTAEVSRLVVHLSGAATHQYQATTLCSDAEHGSGNDSPRLP